MAATADARRAKREPTYTRGNLGVGQGADGERERSGRERSACGERGQRHYFSTAPPGARHRTPRGRVASGGRRDRRRQRRQPGDRIDQNVTLRSVFASAGAKRRRAAPLPNLRRYGRAHKGLVNIGVAKFTTIILYGSGNHQPTTPNSTNLTHSTRKPPVMHSPVISLSRKQHI